MKIPVSMVVRRIGNRVEKQIEYLDVSEKELGDALAPILFPLYEKYAREHPIHQE